MQREIKTTLAIDGEDKFKREMEAASRQLRVLNSEMKANTASFGDNVSSMDALTSRSKILEKQIAQQKEIMQALSKAVDDSSAKYGEADKRTDGYRIKLNNAEAALSKMETELRQNSKALDDYGTETKKASLNLEDFSNKAKGIGEKMTIGITAPVMAAGGALLKGAVDVENASGKLQASLGLTADEAENLETVARSTWTNGFGDNIDTVNMAIKDVRINMGALADEELQKVTEGALTLSDVFDADVKESTAAAGIMMKSFGINGQDAFDLITTGFQKGADYSGELIDTLREYSPQFAAMGMSADQMLGILIKGAEAGAWNLDKVGDAVKEFNIRAQDGSKTTAEGFAAIGLNADKMGQAIAQGGDKGQQAFSATVAALAAMEDPVKQNTAGVALFGTQWEDVRSKVVVAMAEGVKGIDGFKGATDKASKAMRDNNPAVAITSSMRELQDSIGPALLPIADIIKNDIAPAIKSLADGFASLDSGSQKAILTFTGIAAATGPLLVASGPIISTMSKIGPLISGIGAASTAAAGAGTATGIAGLGTALGGATVAAGPWLLAGAAVVGTGYAINKSMSEEAIPAVDLFADKVEMSAEQVQVASESMGAVVETTTTQISEGTKKAVGAYIELDEQASQSLTNLFVNSTTLTEQMTTDMVAKYSEMGTQIKSGMDTHNQQMLTDMQTFFANSSALSDAEEAATLAKLQTDNETKKAEIDGYTQQIQEILNLASQNNRALSLEEQQQINEIQNNMKTNAVKSLSDSEVESKVILERLKSYSTRITAEQAAEVIANAEKQRVESVDKVNQQYDETVANIIKMRDETGVITEEQATKMIEEAQRQKDDSLIKAEELKTGVVEQIETMNEDILKDIDTTDGSIKTGWDKLGDWFSDNPIIRWIKTKTSGGSGGVDVDENWSGSNYYQGGLTTLNERGYEIYDLPKGTRIYNHDASEDLALKTAQAVASQVLAGSRGGITQELNIYSPKALSPSETARLNLKASRQLAMEWGM